MPGARAAGCRQKSQDGSCAAAATQIHASTAGDGRYTLSDVPAGRRVDTVVINTALPRPEVAERYAGEGALPVVVDLDALHALVPRVVTGSFMTTEAILRHDAERVLRALWPELAGP